MLRARLFAAVMAGLFAAMGISSSTLAQDERRSSDDRRGLDAQDEVRSRNNRRSFDDSNISIRQAIRAAEQETGGQVVEADFEYHGGTAVYELEVLTDSQTYEVHVDAQNGDVIRTVSARDDDDNERGRDRDD
jgi:uncharacterized membrane protein YkoI